MDYQGVLNWPLEEVGKKGLNRWLVRYIYLIYNREGGGVSE